jgi:hypothetical protein
MKAFQDSDTLINAVPFDNVEQVADRARQLLARAH